jgi:pimeloyl-ACP methyl ester carboxylesterase
METIRSEADVAGMLSRGRPIERSNSHGAWAKQPPVHSRSLGIVQSNGLILHLQRSGQGSRACLMVHGFGDGSYVWNELLPTIASHYEIFALDLRGHGDSEWDPEARYDVQAHVSDVIHVIRLLGLRRLVLVGHSMGGEIAIRVAMQCAKRIIGLVIVDFAPTLNPEGIELVRAEVEASHQAYRRVEDYACWLAARRPLVSKDVLLRLANCALRAQETEGFKLKADPAILRVSGDESSLWTVLPQMNWPVLVVRGAGSALLSRDVAERMIESMPDARLHSVPMAGHAVMLDNPEGFAGAVGPFLLNLPERQPASFIRT